MKMLVLIAFVAGGLLAIQAAVNAKLGRGLDSPPMAAFVSFVVGLIGLLIYLTFSHPALPSAGALSQIPLWAWMGGLLGAAYVVVTIVVTPRVGVATLTGFVVAGQLFASLILDHFGLFELPKHSLSLGRLLGALLLLAGVVLLKRF